MGWGFESLRRYQHHQRLFSIATIHRQSAVSRQAVAVIAVPLHDRDGNVIDHALADDEDGELLARYCWFLKPSKGTNYAVAMSRNGSRIGRTVLRMHRVVLGLRPVDPGVDHIDGNGLNNQRSNLRFATQSQNMANVPKRKVLTTSSFKGVCWDRQHGRWKAQIQINRRRRTIGLFDSEEAAAEAYDEAAREAWGEFARTNA